MVLPGAWARELMTRPLRQPDQRSCGAAVLVVAEAWRSERYARRLIAGGPARFEAEVLAMHRRTTGAVDVAGRLQLPWSRVVGTPPWAVARQLTGRSGVRHEVRVVWPWRRRRRWAEVGAALQAGWTVPVYLGSALLPRHVVLALEGTEEQLRVYDPAPGRRVRLSARQFVAGEISPGWPTPWFVILPRTRPPRPRARRTPA